MKTKTWLEAVHWVSTLRMCPTCGLRLTSGLIPDSTRVCWDHWAFMIRKIEEPDTDNRYELVMEPLE